MALCVLVIKNYIFSPKNISFCKGYCEKSNKEIRIFEYIRK